MARRVRYETLAIEELVARGGGEMGAGGGQSVLSRDQHDPDGPLGLARVARTYERTAHALQALTLRDGDGREQTLRVTAEHPFRLRFGGWTAARELEPGDTILGAEGTLAVVANAVEPHPEGVRVYNLEVAEAHTYFVLAEEAASDAEPAWVHNANYRETFFDEHPHLRGQVRVHHAVEQQIDRLFPGMYTQVEIHAIENLRGIPNPINSKFHLSQIRRIWNSFYRRYDPNVIMPMRAEVERVRNIIDRRYGGKFLPPR